MTNDPGDEHTSASEVLCHGCGWMGTVIDLDRLPSGVYCPQCDGQDLIYETDELLSEGAD